MKLTQNDINAALQSLGFTEEDIKIPEPEPEPIIDLEIDTPNIINSESVLKEITQLAAMLYKQLKLTPNNPIIILKLIQLLELKMKITGLTNLKPDMQSFIDTEISVYKRKFLEVADQFVGQDVMAKICDKLTAEGL